MPRGANRAVANAGARESQTIPLMNTETLFPMEKYSVMTRPRRLWPQVTKNKKASQKMVNVMSRNAARKPYLATHLANVMMQDVCKKMFVCQSRAFASTPNSQVWQVLRIYSQFTFLRKCKVICNPFVLYVIEKKSFTTVCWQLYGILKQKVMKNASQF